MWPNNTNDNVCGAVIVASQLRVFTLFIWWMQTECQIATNPQTKPSDLACESASMLPSISTIAIYYYYLVQKLNEPQSTDPSHWPGLLCLPSTGLLTARTPTVLCQYQPPSPVPFSDISTRVLVKCCILLSVKFLDLKLCVSSWRGHCKSSPSSCGVCRLNAMLCVCAGGWKIWMLLLRNNACCQSAR